MPWVETDDAEIARLVAGKKVTPTAELIPPLGVARRYSTDALALDDRAIV